MVALLDPQCSRHKARLENPRSRDSLEKAANRVVIERMNKARNLDAVLSGVNPHGELVAEEAGMRLTHAGNPEMLAKRRSLFDVEVVEGDDAVKQLGAIDVADSEERVLEIPLVLLIRHVEHVLQRFARPMRPLLEAQRRQQKHTATLPFSFQQEAVSFLKTREAKQSKGLVGCIHGGPKLF